MVFNSLWYTLINRNKSFQESAFFSLSIQRYLEKEIAKYNPDVVFCDLLRTAQFFNHKKGIRKYRRIFSMCDILSKRYKFLRGTEGDILGNMGSRFHLVQRILMERILRKPLLFIEEKLVHKNECRYTALFEKTLLVSPIEADEVRQKTGVMDVTYLYPAAAQDIGTLSDVPPANYSTLCYMGYLGSPHNERGLLHFLMHIFPKVLKKNPGAMLTVIGDGVTQDLVDVSRQFNSNLVFTGFVDDHRPIVTNTNVFIAPIYFGTGIKTKIIDAMSLGRPVVATPAAVEGLLVKHGENIMIAQTDDDFAGHVDTLIGNHDLNQKIRTNAAAYVNQNHNFTLLNRKFIEILEI
jgi:glycosyltransferase involved in cell wall biosynthesis